MTAISKSQKIPWGPRTIEMFSVGDTFCHHHVTSQSQLIAGFQPYEQFICTMIKTKTTEGTMGCELSFVNGLLDSMLKPAFLPVHDTSSPLKECPLACSHI